MVEINPETQKTRGERVMTVVALVAAALVHLFVFIGGFQFFNWTEEGERKSRLMVIKRVAETTRHALKTDQLAPGKPSVPRDAPVQEEGPDPPPKTDEATEAIDGDMGGGEGDVPLPQDESTETSISVSTDLSSATYSVAGPVDFQGGGLLMTKKGVPTGEYTVTFYDAPGHKAPPAQTKTLAAETRIVFVGRYTPSIEVSVITNIPEATFEIRRPGGGTLPMKRPGRAFFENLPTGGYTITYNDVPKYLTPAPRTKTLKRGSGALEFVGSYLPIGGEERAPVRRGDLVRDRRVQMIVKSYPPTDIEENFDYIRYPEIIIQKSNFQRGVCRVYLVLDIDSTGRIAKFTIERPQRHEYEQYSALIQSVKTAVRRWQYDTISAEVHVDVRFSVE